MSHNSGVPGAVRVAEVLVPLSLVTDLAMGAPDGQSARASVIATNLAQHLGLRGTALADVYYTTLLKHLGCTATAAEEASHLGGDELAARPLFSRTDDARPREAFSLLASIGGGRAPLARGRMIVGALTAARWGIDVQRAVCEVATLVAERLGMSQVVQESLGQTFERWDGKGQPRQLRGEAIATPARFAQVASRAVAFHELGGAPAAMERVRRSRGGWLDPTIADAFLAHGTNLLTDVEAEDSLDLALQLEPQPWRTVNRHGLHQFAQAFADVADLKSAYTLGHSTGVAALVRTAAPRVGLTHAETSDLEVAALLHDIGRVGVPAGVWEKRGRVGSAGWERIRLHPYYSERILTRSRALGGIAQLVGLHHERLDGSGYHRGSQARDIPAAARLLAAADCYRTKTQPRPHRPALPPDAAADMLADEARRGRLDLAAAQAVIEAAGGIARPVLRAAPAGLTEREVEVLRLLAGGCSNRAIAERLVISPRTAEHHVQHIYEKIGASTRAAATMFALQHELVAGTPNP